MPSLEQFAERMRYWCDDADLGYDQIQRWDIYDGGECDCSSLVIHALQEAGFDTGDAYYTGNLSENLTARGWERLWPDISSARQGDVLLSDANHVAAVVYGWGWWATIAEAWLDENYGIYYGAAGDQNGLETRTRGIYDFPWDCILRYTGETDDDMNKEELISTRDSGNIPAWEAWSWAYTYANDMQKDICRKDMSAAEKATGEYVNTGVGMHERLAYCEGYIKQINKKLDNLKVNGATVDYDKLADAVADKLAARMKD